MTEKTEIKIEGDTIIYNGVKYEKVKEVSCDKPNLQCIKIAAVLRAAASQLKLDSNQNSQLGILYSCQEQLNSIADELDYDRQNSQ